MSARRAGRGGVRVDLAVTVGLVVLILGPALLPGYLLRGDWVFVPHQPWKPEWLGTGGAFPRSAPMDAVVWLLTLALPGWAVQKLLLAGALVAGGLGAGRLVASRPWYARGAAIVLFLWNPYVAERLLIGQWALVVGYALLPWVALAALTWARGDSAAAGRGLPRLRWRRAAPLVLTLGLSAVASPPSGAMAVLVAVGVTAGALRGVAGVRRSGGRLLAVLGTGALVNLVWVVPALAARAAPLPADADQFGAFAARAESPLGVLAGLLSLGGIWKSSVVPGARTSAVVVAVAGLVTVASLMVLYRERAREDRPPERALLPGAAAVAVTSFLLAALPTLPGVADALDRAATMAPGLGLLRDSHRFVAPVVLLLLPAAAALVEAVAVAARPGREALRVVAALVALAPMLLLPGLAWGAAGALVPVRYPQEWSTVSGLLDAAPPARVVVLPWAGSYRGFAWNGYRAVLDPAPRFLPGQVLVDDRVLLHGRTLPGEDPVAARVTAALDAPDPAAALRALGVGWVLVEKGMRTGTVPDGVVVHDGPGLQLADLRNGTFRDLRLTNSWLVAAVDISILLLLLTSVAVIVLTPVYAERNIPGEG